METYRVLVVDDSDEEAATLAGHLDRYAADHGFHLQVTRLRSAVEFVAAKKAKDHVFRITVSGILVDGQPVERTWRTTVFDPR